MKYFLNPQAKEELEQTIKTTSWLRNTLY